MKSKNHPTNWFTSLRKKELENCKEFPNNTQKPLKEYSRNCLKNQVEKNFRESKEDDAIEDKIKKNPVKLTGRDQIKVCQICYNNLPKSGSGSRKCQKCGTPYQSAGNIIAEGNKFRKTKCEKSKSRRAEFFSQFMKPGMKTALENVDHRHSIQPIHQQMPAMVGNPSSLENVKGHLRCYGSFVRLPRHTVA